MYGRVMSKHPAINFSGCVIHILAIMGKVGATELGHDVASTLIDVFYHFENSSVRKGDFVKIQQSLEIEELDILKHSPSR